MPYKDKERQKQFQREWIAKRRQEFLSDKACPCGSKDRLTLVKKVALSKADAHFWSLTEKQINRFVKKFQVLCFKCAFEEKRKQQSERRLGKPGSAITMTHSEVWAIRGRLLGKESARSIARAFNLEHSIVLDIQSGRLWGWLERGRRKVYGIDRIQRRRSRSRVLGERV